MLDYTKHRNPCRASQPNQTQNPSSFPQTEHDESEIHSYTDIPGERERRDRIEQGGDGQASYRRRRRILFVLSFPAASS